MTINDPNEPLHYDIDTDLVPNQVMVGLSGHRWEQQGFVLVCRSCPCQHSVNIGKNIFVGIDDKGVPILKKID